MKSFLKKNKNKPTKNKTKNNLWVEKYRPKTINEVVSQEEVVKTLNQSLSKSNLPHLLFYGPPGTGKTSTILAICKQLFGKKLYKKRVKELNASDDRGINVVRTKIKEFSQLYVSGHNKNNKTRISEDTDSEDEDEEEEVEKEKENPTKKKAPCPSFKVIILDEADSMTGDAQAALRRTMEQYSKMTRFCLICNYVSRIIEPLSSRCAKFRFKPLPHTLIKQKLLQICELEKIKQHFPNETIDCIIEKSNGDLRRAITVLQSSVKMYANYSTENENEKEKENPIKIIPENILELFGSIPNEIIKKVFILCKNNDFNKMKDLVENIIYDGYSVSTLLSQLHDFIYSLPTTKNEAKKMNKTKMIIDDKDEDEEEDDDEDVKMKDKNQNDNLLFLSDLKKSSILYKIAEIDKDLFDGGNEYLQLLSICSFMMELINKN